MVGLETGVCKLIYDHNNASCNVSIEDILLHNETNTPLPNIALLILGSLCYIVIWPCLVYDFKCIPFGRIAAVLFGSALMAVTLVLTQEEVYCVLGRKNSLQTLCLLLGMMMFAYYLEREGLLSRLLKPLMKRQRSFYSILWVICLISGVLSSLITNDATCVLLTPLILHEHVRQRRNKREFLPLLLGIATSSNIGSAATVMGNPQNAYIAANVGLNLSQTFLSLFPAAFVGLFINIGLLYVYTYFFYLRKTKCSKEDLSINAVHRDVYTDLSSGSHVVHTTQDNITESSTRHAYYDDVITENECSDVKNGNMMSQNGSVVHPTIEEYSNGNGNFQHMVENDTNVLIGEGKDCEKLPLLQYNLLKRMKVFSTCALHHKVNKQPRYIPTDADPNQELTTSWVMLFDPDSSRLDFDDIIYAPCKFCIHTPSFNRFFWCILVFFLSVTIILLCIPHNNSANLYFDIGLIPIGIASLLLLIDGIINKRSSTETIRHLDWGVILLFCGLFIWLEGFKKTNVPKATFHLLKDYMGVRSFSGVLIFTLFIIIGSNLMSNVPMVILIVDYIKCLPGVQSTNANERDYIILASLMLAWVSTIAGNFTLIGSVANLIVAEKAKRHINYDLSFFNYLPFGFVSTIVVLLLGLPIIYLLGIAVVHI